MRKTLQRLLDSKSSVQLAIFRNFLLDSARSKHEPYNFEETVEILRPKTLSDSGIMLQNPGSTFCAIVDRFKNNANVNHIDRSIAVYLPLLDDVMDAEIHNCATDALIAYINGRDLPDAILHVLRDCNVKEVWGRVTRRLSRRDQLDDVLTAIWRLCDLFMDSRFSALLGSIPLHTFVDTASKLPPISQYTDSVVAMLRTVAFHAAQTIHIPIVTAGIGDNPAWRVKSSLDELQYLSMSSLLHPIKDNLPLGESAAAPEATPQLDPSELHESLSRTRLALLTEFIGACTSSPLPYNAMQTFAHIGSAPAPSPSATELAALQTQFSEHLWTVVKPANERLLQTVLECSLVSGLQWIDIPAAHAMRTALNKAWLLGQQLPVVWDTLEKLPEVEDEAEDTPARVEIVPPE
ncbi:hypothetical protein B0H13DRAFT_371985 [Mycena leptocephala]|nr:hypothetical protein B0H13DRAFT_371985 [Mycena leptocephala]